MRASSARTSSSTSSSVPTTWRTCWTGTTANGCSVSAISWASHASTTGSTDRVCHRAAHPRGDPVPRISGTRICALVRDGQSVRQLTPDPVTRYILDSGLYQSAAAGPALAAPAAHLDAPQRRPPVREVRRLKAARRTHGWAVRGKTGLPHREIVGEADKSRSRSATRAIGRTREGRP